MSLCDDRGLLATDKEMTRKRSRSCVEGHSGSRSQKAPVSVQTNESAFS